MSYKNKNGDVISRRDWGKLPSKEMQSEFQPSGEFPNKSFDGEHFVDLEDSAAEQAPAPPESAASSQEDEEE